MFRAILAALLAIFPIQAQAQDRADTILVLDASGSMWGQIDGKAKITIAQEVIGDLLQSLPSDQNLGLTVYGHRRKGDCSDIETLVAPGPDTREAIASAVNRIKPKGKTPMTDAVKAAAEALRFTENAATVILVSDGVETCNPNICEAARTLEETGVDFTAHVIGFSINDPEAIRQMTCLAQETGGTFRTASNAAELTEALKQVSAPAPEPAPEPKEIRFRALDGKNGAPIGDDLVWDLTSEKGEVIKADLIAPDMVLTLLPGIYQAQVMRPLDEATTSERVVIGKVGKTVTLILPEYRPAATLRAPDSAPASSTVMVGWTGPDARDDYITTARPDDKGAEYVTYEYTREGIEVPLVMPPGPGIYELRYILADGHKILATRTIEVTPLAVTLTAEDEAVAGAQLSVDWNGPDYNGDYISVARPDQSDTQYVNYTYTREGAPLDVRMPAEPGTYELRYVTGPGNRVVATRTVVVTDLKTTLSAPETARIGDTVQVEWTGGDYQGDYVTIARPDQKDARYINYTYTREGNPLGVQMPLEPGDYELRYVNAQDNSVQARQTITVLPLEVNLKAPAAAPAGATITVAWDGPDYNGDYIAVARPGANASSQQAYTYTREGNPLELTLPAEPGTYELRYIAKSGQYAVMASAPITITPVAATLSAPGSAQAGSELSVVWEGPDYNGDYIGIAKKDENGYQTYGYTSSGSPLSLRLPDQPGEYELRYFMRTGNTVIATRPITLN